jgi:hypothetical protein
MNPTALACTALLGLLVAATVCRMLLVIGLVAFARMDRPNPVASSARSAPMSRGWRWTGRCSWGETVAALPPRRRGPDQC